MLALTLGTVAYINLFVKRADVGFIAATFVMATIGGGGGTYISSNRSQSAATPVLTSFSPKEVLGDLKSSSPYTLVEFFDYQCPPCRMSRTSVISTVDKHKDILTFIPRYFPLAMHKNAASAAAAAEAARVQGKFWQMHDALLSGKSLDSEEVVTIARRIGLNEAQFNKQWHGVAKQRVTSDQKAAALLHLNSTPTYLFCTNKGQVWRLSSVEQLEGLIK